MARPATIESLVEETVLAQITAAKAAMPKCPACGGDIARVQLVAQMITRFVVDVNDDGRGGIELDCYSRDTDTLDVKPVMQDRIIDHGSFSEERPSMIVECGSGHYWREPRLRVRKQHGDEFEWEILP